MPWDQRGIRRISEKETAIDGKIYKGGMTMTNREVYERDCEELEQYQEIGTVEECRKAAEKQKPKAPAVDKYHHTCCPSCGWVVAGDTGWGKEYLPHCENCGQAILWDKDLEETNDERD